MTLQSVLITMAVIGLVSCILGFLVLNPAGTIALIVLGVLCAAISLGIDIYGLYQAWKSKARPGIYDKKFSAFIGALMLASLGGATAVTMLFRLSPLGLISTAITCLLGFILAMASYLIATHKQDRWNRNHPSLERFYEELKGIRSLSGDKIPPEILARFKKLPKKDKQAIYNLYLKEAKSNQLSFKATQLNGSEGEVLLRAVKKTTRIFWNRWEQTHSANTLNQAKKLQLLQDQIRAQETWDENAARKLNRELKSFQKRNSETFKDLSKQVECFRKLREGEVSTFKKHVEHMLRPA